MVSLIADQIITDPRVGSYRMDPRVGSYRMDPRVGSYRMDPRVGSYRMDPRVGSYRMDPRVGSYRMDPRVGSYRMDPRVGSYRMDPRVGSYRMDPRVGSYRAIRRSLTVDAAHALVRSLIHSRLDYCNSVLVGLPDYMINRLQSVLRSAARPVLQLPKRSHALERMQAELHWLVYPHRLYYKVGVISYKCLHVLRIG